MDTRTKALSDDLRSFDKHRRDSALRRIRALPEEDAIKTLIELMLTNPALRFPYWAVAIRLFFVSPLWILSALFVYHQLRVFGFMGVLLILFTLISKLYVGAYAEVYSKQIPWATSLLSEYSDVRLLLLCVTEWKASEGEKRVNLLNGLVRNLPLLTPEIAEKMTTEKRKQLRELVFVESTALQRVTLETLLHIEDLNAIPHVETLVKNTPNSEVREAAEGCLSGLLTLKQREKDREVLLRPSLEENGKEVLLRPATSHNDDDEQQLLRPGNKGE